MVFIGLGGGDLAETRVQIDALRRMAREEFGRTVQVWTSAYAICRPTEREARDYFRYYTEERGDREAVENLVRVRINQPDRVSSEDLETMKSRMIAGWAATRSSAPRSRSWTGSSSSRKRGSTGSCCPG
jgi:alkanesulfonate monooxygenase SsuD/methylene tetrahydromethanopterin reductase-like flavin-dependent oxidoreductase (luciferase family)